jgi:MraZ protein
MFRGHFEHAIDDKGRVAVPASFRGALVGLQDERLVLTKFRQDGVRCLDVYPLSAWRRLEDKLSSRNRFDKKLLRFRNFYVAGAHECALDGQGRVLIPQLLREYAGLGRAVIFTGDVDMFRIWDRDTWQAKFADDEERVLGDDDFLSGLDI